MSKTVLKRIDKKMEKLIIIKQKEKSKKNKPISFVKASRLYALELVKK